MVCRKKVILILILFIFIVSSCATNDDNIIENISENTRITASGIPIPEAVSWSDEDSLIPYPIQDWEFDVDADEKTITGLYVDANFCICFNLDYYDYDVTFANVYSTTDYFIPEYFVEGEWEPIYYENQSFPKVEVYYLPDVDFITDFLDETYSETSFSKNVVCVSYLSTEEDVNNGLLHVWSNDWREDYTRDFICDSSIYYVREELDGLPVGVMPYNSDVYRHYPWMNYSDYRGYISSYHSDYRRSYYNLDATKLINVNQYILDNIVIEEENVAIVPLSECIDDSVPGILNKLYYGNGMYTADVYSAELVYGMFTVDARQPYETPTLVFYIPIWEISFCSVEGDRKFYSSVYINATDGSLMDPILYHTIYDDLIIQE